MKLYYLIIPIFVRVLIAIEGYSGINDPPKFGDFEAQRHWMELAVNSSPSEWYVESEFNDLKWWPLDYPPLSGYYAWFWGKIAQYFDQTIIEPIISRGIETFNTKLLMRLSVFVSEIIFLFPPLLYQISKMQNKSFSKATYILCSPLLMLIDHGHFQYNCILLGLSLGSAQLLLNNRLYLGGILYVFAINFKVMGLYYSLAIFVYILSVLSQKSKNYIQFLLSVAKMGLLVVAVTLIIWLPWLSSINDALQVLKAIFPVHRGLYQLQVATFWCFSNIFIKWGQLFQTQVLLRISTILTLVGSAFAMRKLYQNPKHLLRYMFTISQAFFLFSFHVHEKTILLPLIFVLANIEYYGWLAHDYVIISLITHHPLMKEDKLFTEYLIVLLVFIFFQFESDSKLCQLKIVKLYRNIRYLPIIFYLIISIAQLYIPPPQKYPYIYELGIQMIGFGYYSFMYILSHVDIKQKY
ncbi:hypothetical protein pb186bvf_014963 [Paramecium bursaria]